MLKKVRTKITTTYLFESNAPEDIDKKTIRCYEIEQGKYYKFHHNDGSITEGYVAMVMDGNSGTQGADIIYIENRERTAQAALNATIINRIEKA